MYFKYLGLFIVLFLFSCNRNITKTSNYFTLKESFSETWVASETEKGTTITVILENVLSDVEFDSLVYNEKQLPLTVTNKEGVYTLTAQINAPSSKLATKIIHVNKPNELVYKIHDKKLYFPLTDIKPKKMRYLKQ